MQGQLKIKPLSVNACWQGRRFKNRAYKDYEEELLWQLKGHAKINGNYRLWLNFYLRNASRTDISNLIKPIEDIFVKAGLVEDDRYCAELHVAKFKSKEDIINWHIENVTIEEKE